MKKLMKKLLVMTVLCTTFALVGCGVNNDLTVDQIENSMSKAVKFEKMEKGDGKSLKRYYKLNINDYQDLLP